jgi:hypothetical protein
LIVRIHPAEKVRKWRTLKSLARSVRTIAKMVANLPAANRLPRFKFA